MNGVGKREGNGSLDALQQIGYIKPYRLPLYIGTHIVSDIAPGNVDHMPPGHTMTVSLRECANMAYIGNYIGTHILS